MLPHQRRSLLQQLLDAVTSMILIAIGFNILDWDDVDIQRAEYGSYDFHDGGLVGSLLARS